MKNILTFLLIFLLLAGCTHHRPKRTSSIHKQNIKRNLSTREIKVNAFRESRRSKRVHRDSFGDTLVESFFIGIMESLGEIFIKAVIFSLFDSDGDSDEDEIYEDEEDSFSTWE